MSPPTLRRALAVLVSATAVIAVGASSAQAQATRTWVSGVGDDVNPCSRTAPCSTFSGAQVKTAAGGEINAIDPGDYGPITIDRALIIDGRGTSARIGAGGGSGVAITAGATNDVTLRNLTIDGSGTGTAACPYSGQIGIRVLTARLVNLEDLHIDHFVTAGVAVAPSTDVDVFANRVAVKQVCDRAFSFAPLGTATVDALLRGISVEAAGTGVFAGDRSKVTVKDSQMVGTAVRLQSAGTGAITDAGGNGFSEPVVKTVPGPATTTTTTVTTPGPPGPAITTPGRTVTVTAPGASTVCAVPSLKGLTLTKAKSSLKLFRCKLGKVTYKTTTRTSQVGRVISQKLKAGTQTKVDSTVAITVGKKKPAAKKKGKR